MSAGPTSAATWAAIAATLVKEIPALAVVPAADVALALPVIALLGDDAIELIFAAQRYTEQLGIHVGPIDPENPGAPRYFVNKEGNRL